MVTLELTILVDDDIEAEDVNRAVCRAVDKAKDDQDEQYGFEWFETDTTSERPYAKEQ